MHYSYLPIFKVYLINLKHREDRRDRMQRSLEVLGIDVTLTDAVDGKYDIITHTFTSVTQSQSSTYCLSSLLLYAKHISLLHSQI